MQQCNGFSEKLSYRKEACHFYTLSYLVANETHKTPPIIDRTEGCTAEDLD